MLKLLSVLKDEQVQSLGRHALTAIGGILVSDGIISANQTEEFVSAGVFFVSLIWAQWKMASKKTELAAVKTELAEVKGEAQ